MNQAGIWHQGKEMHCYERGRGSSQPLPSQPHTAQGEEGVCMSLKEEESCSKPILMPAPQAGTVAEGLGK